ncbi:hypothetical protein BS78_02G249400 [Paspalum vaginatum]|nr:hypothetical protein BS78_02G249400 [Paspalum vaginatum]
MWHGLMPTDIQWHNIECPEKMTVSTLQILVDQNFWSYPKGQRQTVGNYRFHQILPDVSHGGNFSTFLHVEEVLLTAGRRCLLFPLGITTCVPFYYVPLSLPSVLPLIINLVGLHGTNPFSSFVFFLLIWIKSWPNCVEIWQFGHGFEPEKSAGTCLDHCSEPQSTEEWCTENTICNCGVLPCQLIWLTRIVLV